MAPKDNDQKTGNPYTPSGGGDEPQSETRQDSGITQSESRAANDPATDVAGTAMEGTPGTGTEDT